MDILTQSSLLVAITSFAVSASVLSRDIRNKLFLVYSLLTFVIFGWSLCFFLDQIQEVRGVSGFYIGHLAFHIWIAPVALPFIQLLIRKPSRLENPLFFGSLALAVLFSLGLVMGWERFPFFLTMAYFLPSLVAFRIVDLVLMDHRDRLRRSGRMQKGSAGTKRQLVYFGALLVLATSTMDHVPQLGSIIPSLGNLALAVYVFLLGQAITFQRLLNLSAVLSRFLVLLIVALMLTGVYLLLFAWIEGKFALFFLNSFFISFLILMLLDPLRALVSFFARRMVTKEHRLLHSKRALFERKLAGVLTMENFSDLIMSAVAEMVRPQRHTLFLLSGEGTRFKGVRNQGDGQSAGTRVKEILADHPLIEYVLLLLKRGDLPVILGPALENEIDRTASRSTKEKLRGLRQGLRALDSNLLIPLIEGSPAEGDSPAPRVLGFVTLLVPTPPEIWGSHWGLLPSLYPFFGQAALRLGNLEIYTQQREKDRLAELGEMAAGLAHEIRNPLGAIKGAAQLLKAEDDPSSPFGQRAHSKFLDVIEEEVDRLNEVVTQFLDYSKPYALEEEPVDIVKLTINTIENLKPSVPSGIELEFEGFDATQSEQAMCLGSSTQFRQVLVNLIRNGIQAVERTGRGGKIRVFVQVGQQVMLSVEDDGAGIKKEDLDKLFIPFFTKSPKGTGLGLSICHKIAESHRGRIEVTSEEGKYSRFSVFLPRFSARSSARSDGVFS